ncbi:hypothetical protein [Helicobacter winghamensis]|uniref:Uncharacterized protein n=1 Tax=Helicobacter winghamensis TaxID=157268 RepID=A0A2N3PLP7_9HELI|nr:hypothetical protein [Helicobacter winghamensis]PKT75268.1 hypothetical protein BCM32_06915 [Helicobacter winghamensis]PKT82764.1 hypothetical protein BCM31_06340 [Helicobacter winghamensis]PKT82900.1 hypothetical protein BCM33_05815 [Helicobacter winghamensis]QOQ97609.1 hypothetical protein A0Z60_06025 [Helicobacter winghamensis]
MVANTGTPRSITGHAISGGLIAFMLSGAYAYAKYKRKEISRQEAITDTLKASVEGGILTACGIAAANALGSNTKTTTQGIIEASAFVAVGAASVYGIQTLASKGCCANTKFLTKDQYGTTKSK